MKLLSLPSQSELILCVDTIVDTNPWRFDRLFYAWHQIQVHEGHLNVKIDFQYCDFLGHEGVAFLGGLAHLIKARGGEVIFQWDTLNSEIRMNLAQNGFLQNFGHSWGPWDGNSIPYCCTLQYDADTIVDYLQYKWLSKGWVNVSSGLRDAIAGKVSEIYLNAFQHSQTQIGVFSCGQHYPKMGLLQLTVIDFGIGITENVRSLPENANMSTTEALSWAFQTGTSTRKDGVCGGMGLSLLQDFMIQNHGNLMIFSNDGCVIIDDNGTKYENKCINFSGTLVNISLKCDESYYCLASEIADVEGPWF